MQKLIRRRPPTEAALPLFDDNFSPHEKQGLVTVGDFGGNIGVIGILFSFFQTGWRPLYSHVTRRTVVWE